MAAEVLSIQSSAFTAGAAIPARHTCDGDDALPPLRIAGLPPGTARLALLVDDPDAPSGVFTHLLAWDLPASATTLDGALPAGAVLGTNDFGRPGWNGPCPPPGKPHRYRFRVMALPAPLGLRAGADRAAFDRAVAGRALAEATLVGTYGRRR
jgi:Raf kinase inhibitor-like YbhB/YbcL family protein